MPNETPLEIWGDATKCALIGEYIDDVTDACSFFWRSQTTMTPITLGVGLVWVDQSGINRLVEKITGTQIKLDAALRAALTFVPSYLAIEKLRPICVRGDQNHTRRRIRAHLEMENVSSISAHIDRVWQSLLPTTLMLA